MAYNLNFQLTEFKFPAQNYALNTATMPSKTNASQLFSQQSYLKAIGIGHK